jgi:hypothetical protein
MRNLSTLAIVCATLSSCQTPPERSVGGVVETHAEMVGAINSASLTIADVLDKSRSETEGLDPTIMDTAAWGRMEEAARALEASSRRMAEARVLRVGPHTDVGPGFATKDEIQARIDADPRWFRRTSLKMAEDSSELAAAAAARNLRRTRDLAQIVNESCQSCHTRYWENPRS